MDCQHCRKPRPWRLRQPAYVTALAALRACKKNEIIHAIPEAASIRPAQFLQHHLFFQTSIEPTRHPTT